MTDSKEKILRAALRLFARHGYEAASVSAIAGELGMSKGALYRHYTNKRDIFNSIVARMYQLDHERAEEYGVPPETFEQTPLAYRDMAVEKIRGFLEAQFRFWTEDEFACDFRKLLTLEQYRSPEMADLYQKCLAGGPVSYLKDLFREMMEQNVLLKSDPELLALEFYAPFYLLMSIADTPPGRPKAARLLAAQLTRFIQHHTSK